MFYTIGPWFMLDIYYVTRIIDENLVFPLACAIKLLAVVNCLKTVSLTLALNLNLNSHLLCFYWYIDKP